MDFNLQFKKFNEKITLSDSKSDKLISSASAIKDVINAYFKEKGKSCPLYHQQGSFPMKTTIQLISDKDYDIDIGVYLQGYENTPKSDYPSPASAHQWILDATEDQTKSRSNNKNACVRVNYSEDYHIDLPIYITTNTGDVFLAKLNDGWVKSDPISFTNWFNDKAKDTNGQLKRIVKYMKAWRDYKSLTILKSICINILVGNNFVSDNSDHVSLVKTLKSIINNLTLSFVCKKPVSPYENLFTDIDKEDLMNKLQNFADKLETALNSEAIDSVNKIMKSLFGDRFPELLNENFKSDSPGVLRSDGRSGN